MSLTVDDKKWIIKLVMVAVTVICKCSMRSIHDQFRCMYPTTWTPDKKA